MSIITVRVDDATKEQAEHLFADLGLTMTAAMNVFLKQAIRENGLPFLPTKDVPNAQTVAAMDAAQTGDNMYGPFDSVAELMEALNAED